MLVGGPPLPPDGRLGLMASACMLSISELTPMIVSATHAGWSPISPLNGSSPHPFQSDQTPKRT